MTEKEALIALNMMPGIGSVTVLRMRESFGSAAAVFEAEPEDIRAVRGFSNVRARNLYDALRTVPFKEEIARADRKDISLVSIDDDFYPALLREIADPPLVLYVAGDPAALCVKDGCAIIGTRHASLYGRETARKFGYQLAAAGYAVISGFARGIDTEAHVGAVQANGTTVAVLGGALDKLYPRENAKFAGEVIAKGGAIITEYPFGRQADRQSFPQRNRIVSGMSRGVLVVESPDRSGTMITVAQALEQGRSVMAVPGRIDSRVSSGCHRLIREGARLVTSVDDVLEELQDLFAAARYEKDEEKRGTAESAEKKVVLTPEERMVYSAISEEGSYADTVVRASGLAAGKVNAILVGLRIKRLVKAGPGGFFQRLKSS